MNKVITDARQRLSEAGILLNLARVSECDSDVFVACITGFIALAYSCIEFIRRSQGTVIFRPTWQLFTGPQSSAKALFAFFDGTRKITMHRETVAQTASRLPNWFPITDEHGAANWAPLHVIHWTFDGALAYGLPASSVLALCEQYQARMSDYLEALAACN